MLFGNIIIINPSSVFSRNHALGTQNITIPTTVKFLKNVLNLLLGVGIGSLYAPASEHFVCMMMVMVMTTA